MADDAPDPQLRAQMEELHKQTQMRMALRRSNSVEAVEQLRADIATGVVKLKSDIKKSSAFGKKLRMLTEHNADVLAKDTKELNLTRYVTECVASIAEAPLKMADLPAAVRVISLLHQRYAEFSTLLVDALTTAFDGSYGTEDKHKLVKRRILLRLLSELYLAGVFHDVQVIATIVQRVVRREGGPAGKSKSKGNMSLAGSSSSSAQLEVPLLVSFAKSVGAEFLGVLPKKYKEITAAFGDEFAPVVRFQQGLVPQSVQNQCLACFQEAYDLICKYYLTQHGALVKLRKRNDREEINRGEISEQHVQELENAKLLFEKLQTSVNALADALDKDVPALPVEKTDDELLGSGISLWEGGEGGARSELRADSPFDDEDTRSFYEDLPDLLELVPAVVLGLTEADVAELKKKKEAEASGEAAAEEEAEAEAEGDDDDAEADGDDAGDADAEGPELREDAEPTPESTEESATTTSTDTGKAASGGYHHQLDSFFTSLEDMVNRDRCDKAAVEFCYKNSKPNRNRLVKTLYSVPRTHLELLAYYARLIATLQRVFKDDIAGELVDLLVSEFNYLIKKRNQFRLESKVKNIRFIAELIKFKVCPPAVAFRCLKRCFADFQGHNVHVATALLENCGRFLYCSKTTHVRTENFLGIMMKLKSAKHLDPQAETLVENAYYMCKPPERVERAVKQYDPMYLFVLKLLYEDLNDSTMSRIIKTLRKLPWNDSATTDMVVKAVLKVTKGRVMQMRSVCQVVKRLARYHEEFSIVLVDDVLESIRHGLELNDYRDHQVSLGNVKLLGELFSVGLVSMSVIFDTLYLLINHSHDLWTLPQYSAPQATAAPTSTDQGAASAPLTATQIEEFKRRCRLVPDLRFDPRVPSEVDSPSDVFRIRMVCALVEACNLRVSGASGASNADRGVSKTRLGRFMTFFQRYILSKSEIPLETDFVVLDLFDALASSLKDHFRRFEEWDDADNAVTEILRQELEVAERKLAKQNSTTAATTGVSADGQRRTSMDETGALDDEYDEYGEEDDDSDEDDDDEDDDEEEDDEDEARGEEGDDDEDDDDDGDDDDDEEEEEEDEEEEEQLIIHDRVQKTEEDEDFEKAFKAMMSNTSEPRKLLGRVGVDKMAIPTMIKSSTQPPPALAMMTSNPSDNPNGVVFRMLRRGNKGKVEARHLLVPQDTSLAQHSFRQEHAGKQQMSELKRLVLQNVEREDFLISPNTGVEMLSTAPTSSSARPAIQQTHRVQSEVHRAGYGANAEWNNAEFGLRRGKGYRGAK
ncbi:hypothetical protein Poli38472_012236 [Pythium oligandrum]|uniref:MIF4G domain-containing protein n=1 Tax=Pythium oligandrum TaxID=41045 RepID=A0A8K1CPI5_PYTOL|nr:hypothetical protein Poli38472_012236 [Pythium oligandrum]|eukprot:TMW67120.1 hypothetical protein Poli38472_012236 [Pythium oligandrum]